MAIVPEIKKPIPELYRLDFLDSFVLGWMEAANIYNPKDSNPVKMRRCLEHLGEDNYSQLISIEQIYYRQRKLLRKIRAAKNIEKNQRKESMNDKFRFLKEQLQDPSFREDLKVLSTFLGAESNIGKLLTACEDIYENL